jgi:glycerophosphoryl diester phosphodiesterase
MLVLGHRGVIAEGKDAPYQNSLRAFAEALGAGDGFETDACLDRDGEIFLIHEAKYADPQTGVEYSMAEHLDPASAALLGDRRLDQLATSEARRLRLKDGQPMPTLEQAIVLTGARSGKLLDIELKSHGVVEPVLRLVTSCLQRNLIAPSSLLLSSFNHYALQAVRKDAPGLSVGAIFVGADQPTAPLFPWRPEDPAAYTALTPEALKSPVLRQVQPDCFVVPEENLTRETVAMIGAEYPDAKLVAWVFTEKGNFDLPDLLARLKSLPQDKIAAMIVDHPRVFMRASRSS